MPAHQPITLTISIVTFQTPPAQLDALIASLTAALDAAASSKLAVEPRIVLIDNGEPASLNQASVAAYEVRLKTLNCGLTLLAGHGNVGYGRGHNLAILPGEDRYHLILNPDVELDPDGLVEGLSYLEAHPEATLVTPRASDDQGARQYLCKRYPSVLTLFLRGFAPAWLRRHFEGRLAHYEMRDLPDESSAQGIELASGCCMLCRGERLRAVQGFDERFFLYFEDFDLSMRLAEGIVYLPGMKIVHHGGHSARKGSRHIAMFIRSAIRFFNLHGWRWL